MAKATDPMDPANVLGFVSGVVASGTAYEALWDRCQKAEAALAAADELADFTKWWLGSLPPAAFTAGSTGKVQDSLAAYQAAREEATNG